MKIKKYLTALFLTVACLCAGFAFGCVPEETTPPDGDTKYKVVFAEGENFKYKMGGEEFASKETEVSNGAEVTFSLVLGEGYGSPVVKAGDSELSANNGEYKFTVNSDVTVSASVSELAHSLSGEGTDESPFIISTVKDLLFTAQSVNSGNATYVTAFYELAGDIDCGGAKLDVIGDFRNSSAFFAGNFNGKNHTVSNFVIDPGTSTEYVGFFGCIQPRLGVDNTGIIQKLHLKDFEISASASSTSNVCVGAFAGLSAGASIVACSATDGRIHAYGSTYFSYAGGAVGIMQGVTVQSNGMESHYFASVENVSTNVDITSSMYVLAAGGIAGYAFSDSDKGSAAIVNCFAGGQIFGAMRAGGIVGWLSNYTAVANCYSDSFLSATANFNVSPADNTENPEFYYAYAGGIAAYAGRNTVISNSFSLSETEAYGGKTEALEGDIVAGNERATKFERELVIYNSYFGDSIKPTDSAWVKNTLKWHSSDWVIVGGKSPAVNFEGTAEHIFNFTVNYGSQKVEGASSADVKVTVKQNNYSPFVYYLDEEIKEYVTSEDGLTSYGYFFDSACTQKVPFGYMITGEVTLYVGFADYKEVAGKYYFDGDYDRTVVLELSADGNYSYIDTLSFAATYTYDGTDIILNNGLFVRLYRNIEWANTPELDAYFNPVSFAGVRSDSGISIYDGTYFTESAPLVFKSSAPVTSGDVFKGVWEKSATLNTVKYEFDGVGAWKYWVKGSVAASGSYTVSGGVADLGNGKTATIDASGLLNVGGEFFCYQDSFYGIWRAQSDATQISLDGFGKGLAGGAVAVVQGRAYEGLMYVKDGFFDGLSGKPDNTYTLLSGTQVFGYFVYNPDTRTISAHFYDSSAAKFISYNCYLVDNYNGVWVGEESIDGVSFEILDFNGMGIYNTDGSDGSAPKGYLTVNGEKVPYECTVESGLEGVFTYKGKEYKLVYADGVITVSQSGSNAELIRRDVMYDLPLTDSVHNVYRFDGRGNLPNGGTLTVTPVKGDATVYGYKIKSGTVNMDLETPVTDIVISIFNKDNSAEELGTITIDGYKFIFRLKGETDRSLNLYLPFAGKTWAISNRDNTFYIGDFDLSYEAKGMFNNTSDVTYAYFPQYNYIYLFYGNQMDGFVQIYLLLLNDGNIAVSSYPYQVAGDYNYASPCDEIYGGWTNTLNRNHKLAFDGLADSGFALGTAHEASESGLKTYAYTRRFGKIYMWVYDNEEEAYVLENLNNEATGEKIFLKDGGSRYDRMQLTSFDVLNSPIMTAYNGNVKYEFKFDGTITFSGKTGEYLIESADNDFTTVVIRVSGEEEVTVIIDHEERTVTPIN